MRHRLGRVRVVTALLALSASWAAGWAVAFHLATDDHHGPSAADRGGLRELEMAIHGHAHSEGTPAHSHTVVGGVAAPVPARLSLLAPAMTGDTPEAVLTATSGHRLASQAGPNHDPPPRGVTVSILRI
jgi:hypothetical protein